MDFIRNNLLLVAVAFISGAMLLWPLVRMRAGGPRVNSAQATLMINREDALMLDVRDAAEFAAEHVIGARNVPLARIDDGANDLAKRKDRPLVVYCDGGERSTKAVAALAKQGFARVVSLSGGLGAWRSAGLPVEK